MNRGLVACALGAVLLLLPGCSSQKAFTGDPAPLTGVTMVTGDAVASAVFRITQAVPEATKTIKITEANDGNNLIGRPNGYTAASVIEDSRVGCPEPPTPIGIDCGAMIEEWPDEESAQRRSDYIQSVRKNMPMLGQEYGTVRGNLLLRVSGELKPSQSREYEEAFS